LTERAHLAKLADGFRQRNFHLDQHFLRFGEIEKLADRAKLEPGSLKPLLPVSVHRCYFPYIRLHHMTQASYQSRTNLLRIWIEERSVRRALIGLTRPRKECSLTPKLNGERELGQGG